MKTMLIRTWSLDGTAVLDVVGHLGVETVPSLHDAVCRTVRDGSRHLVLNLSDVSDVDAAGLGEIASAMATTRGAGGDLKLVVGHSMVADLLSRTHLLDVCPTYLTEADALSSFHPALSH